MVSVNNCYTFQIIDHLKQSRPSVKNPLVELSPFKDETLCAVTTLKEYLTRTQSLRCSESQLFISYNRHFKRVSRDTISRYVKLVLTLESIHPGLNHTVLGLPARLQPVMLQ